MRKLGSTAAWLAVISAVGALAQAPVRVLHVVALNKAGQPVSDLKASDLRLTDDGRQQSIVSLQLHDTRTGAAAEAHVTIILFDLLNNTLLDRSYVAGTIERALEKAEDPGSIYLYLLTTEGALYPVRGLPPPGTPPTDQDWTVNDRALIDKALNQVLGAGPVNRRFEGNPEALTFQTLRKMAAALAVFPGHKSVIWSTRGFPAAGLEQAERQLGAEMDHAGITLYTVDESGSVTTVLARSMLGELTGATGGKVYEAGQTPKALEDAAAEMRLYYTLSYQPVEKNWDGKFHKLKLTCARKDVRIRTEDGYIADVPTPQEETPR